ncbi:MAG TPA: nicotinamide-nucleotide amidohydrolase family protein [Spirochaetia bacterium]|nr:nicotinamide-nucleotide amidohydrolase family protein [Spirochaetia bacterium]
MSGSRPRTVVLLSAGTELTEGITQDSHVRFLASELTSLGFRVLRGLQVPDDVELFRAELSRAVEQAGLVIVTGGLGPTSDDLSRELVAEAAGVPLDFHQEAWDAILARFAGRTVASTNRKQAMAPRGFTLLPNANGTAPGFHGPVGGACVVALPGPPSELRPMFSTGVVPVLARLFGTGGVTDVLWGTALMVPESSLEEALRSGAAGLGIQDIRWGTRVDEDRIAFSLRGGTPAGRDALFEALVSTLGQTRVRRGETRPAQLVTEALLERGARLVVAESCTGGLIAKYLTDLSGSSRVFWGGFLSYANEAKETLLGVDRRTLDEHGAVSEPVVIAMSEGARKSSGAEAAVAVSGVAGPEGGTPEKPVGTVWIAVSLKDGGSSAWRFAFSGSRDMVRRRSAVAALLAVEARLRGREFLDTRMKW